jgi:hypothetical protein
MEELYFGIAVTRLNALVAMAIVLVFRLLDNGCGHAQLSSECRQTRTSYLRNSLIIWIGQDVEQFLDTVAPDRCNDSELGKMAPDCIDHPRPWE